MPLPDAQVRFLLVNDDPEYVLQMEAIVGESFELHWAKSVLDAKQQASQHCFDLILIDVSLPDATGIEAVQHLRSEVNAPILLLLDEHDDELIRSAAEAGAEQCVLKTGLTARDLERVRQDARAAQVVPAGAGVSYVQTLHDGVESAEFAPSAWSCHVESRDDASVLRPYTGDSFQPAVFSQHNPDLGYDNPQPVGPTRRLMFLVMFAVCLAIAGHQTRDRFLPLPACGLVTGSQERVKSPFNGIVDSVHVRYGEKVTKGQLLATIQNPMQREQVEELKRKRSSLQRQLQRQAVALRWQAGQLREEQDQDTAHYYETWAALVAAQGRLSELRGLRDRAQSLLPQGMTTPQELQRLTKAVQKQEQESRRLGLAVEHLESSPVGLSDRLPAESKAQALLKQLGENREKAQGIERESQFGHLVAPFDAVVVSTECLVGDAVEQGQVVLQLAPSSSLEISLYVDRRTLHRMMTHGQGLVEVIVADNQQVIPCRVKRVGEATDAYPPGVADLGKVRQPLYPLKLEPVTAQVLPMTYGKRVRLPTHWPWSHITGT